MKKLLFAIVIFMLMAGSAIAKDPEYEVTIHVVYNSIPVHEIGDLVRDQLRKHQDACKVEVKIRNPEDTLQGVSLTDGLWLNTGTGAVTQIWTDDDNLGDTASD